MAIVPVTIWLNFETVGHQGYARFAVFFILLIRYPGLVTKLPSPPLDAQGNLCSLASDALCAVWKSMFFHIYPHHCLLR